VVFALKSTN